MYKLFLSFERHIGYHNYAQKHSYEATAPEMKI